MKTFAVFLFDDNKEGLERYLYMGDEQSDNPEQTAIDFYVRTWKDESLRSKLKATTLDMQITIPISEKKKIKFASQVNAFIPRNGGKSIILAERIM